MFRGLVATGRTACGQTGATVIGAVHVIYQCNSRTDLAAFTLRGSSDSGWWNQRSYAQLNSLPTCGVETGTFDTTFCRGEIV